MDALYYLSIILLVIGLPALLLLMIIALIKPLVTQKLFKQKWSRKRISIVGSTSILIGLVGFSLIINATMPASVRAEIAEQQKVEAATKAKELANKQTAKEIEKQKETLANQPVIKIETVTSSIQFSSSEKEDASLPKGQRKTTAIGVNGEKTETYEVTYVKGKQTAKKLVKSEVTTQPVNELISVGTYVPPAQAPKSVPTNAAPLSDQSTPVYYANCSAARAAGAAPLYKGQPGYRSGLDRDHDGKACE